MNYKVLLDVAMPGPAVTRSLGWLLAFVVIALVIIVASVIIVVRGVKKAKMEEARKAADEPEASHDITQD
ncbi:MAG: hypothetical protein J5626_01485 [Lachnospiraceae bacterium]|nr:hypothetical protein [Lachnospiraceae bacterium]